MVAYYPIIALEEKQDVDNPDPADQHGNDQDELARGAQLRGNPGRQPSGPEGGADLEQDMLEGHILQPHHRDHKCEDQKNGDEEYEKRARDILFYQFSAKHLHIFVAAHMIDHRCDHDKKCRRPDPAADTARGGTDKHQTSKHQQGRG